MRAAFFLLACVVTAALAQPAPHFEVASVKPSVPGAPYSKFMEGGPGTSDPTRLAFNNADLRSLVLYAYDVRLSQFSAPAWLPEARFDIVAKVTAGASRQDVRPMLQNLLIERFHLRTVHQLREADAYALTTAKGGPKMTAYAAALPEGFVENAVKFTGFDKDGFLIAAPGYAIATIGTSGGLTRISIARLPIRELCNLLTGVLQNPVVDQTGLTGRYDVRLRFAPDSAGLSGDDAPKASDPAPTVFQAVQTQLGLRLERKKLPVDFLVVEHIERVPTEN